MSKVRQVRASPMKVLLATYNYPPESYGGSEVYVESLASELGRQGQEVEIVAGSTLAAPESDRFSLNADAYNGVPVWRFRLNPQRYVMRELYTTRSPDLRTFWKDWLPSHRPDVLHFHGRSLTVSNSMMEAAADLNIPMVFTVHNVTMLCSRGDYIMSTGKVCDGRAGLQKCVACTAASRLGAAAGAAMGALSPLLSRLAVPGGSQWPKMKSGLLYPALMRLRLEAQSEMLSIVRRWHVFSDWSRQALELNGVPREKIVLLRHAWSAEDAPRLARVARGDRLRVGYFGRFHKVKGVSVLLEAMRFAPDTPIRLEIFGDAQNSPDAEVGERIRSAAAQDSRIVWRGRIPHSEQPSALANLDAVVIPSLGVETGPLTVLEAFAAGIPVVGSNLSGINEWVREGRNGWLFPPGDGRALAAILGRLAANPRLLDTAQDFPVLDSMANHARQVIHIYQSLFPANLT